MKTFKLKSFPEYFQATKNGFKRHELRNTSDVPGIAVGDQIILQEFDPTTGQFSGAALIVYVTFISPQPRPWLAPGFTLMSITTKEWWHFWKSIPKAVYESPENPLPLAGTNPTEAPAPVPTADETCH